MRVEGFGQSVEAAPEAPNAMNGQTLGQPVRYLPVFGEPTKDRQVVPAGQRIFCTFETATPDPIENQTGAGGTEPARRQLCIGALQPASIGYYDPKEPVCSCRQLALQRSSAVSKVDDDCVVFGPRCTHPLKSVERVRPDLT
jgi:hypothetical protein